MWWTAGCRSKCTVGSSCPRFRGWQGEVHCFAILWQGVELFCNILLHSCDHLQVDKWHSVHTVRHTVKWHSVHTLSSTLTAHCQAHWESGEGEAKIPSQGFVQQLKQVNQVWLNSLIPIPIKTQLASATSAPLCFWRDSLSSDDEKKAKKKSNGKGVEGVACIAYQLNFEQTSQTLVVTILQCRSPLAFIDGPSQWVIN